MLAVACCRRVSNMLHLTPDSMVGYSFSASHTLISLHPVFAVQPSVQLCDDFLLRNQPSSWAINLSEPSRLAPRLRSLGHSKAALFTTLCALGWLLPVASYCLGQAVAVLDLTLFAGHIYDLPACWNNKAHVSPSAPLPTPTISSPPRLVPMNSQASEPGYFFLVRTSQADLRDIHVPSSSSPAPPFVEI